MISAPREIVTPYRPIPLEVPEGMKPNEFFNSAENLADLVHNNGLLANPEGLLFYRKAIGHSNLFDGSIIYNTSQRILDPLGRPVRRSQVPEPVRHVWNRMNRIALEFMLERYPDPARHLVLAGEASLDATWPLTAPGVPSIRMLHNHFIVFDKDDLAAAAPADPDNPNLTDGGQHSLFQAHMRDAYRAFFAGLDLKLLAPCERGECRLALTGYPQGLPSWEVKGGAAGLGEVRFWHEYDMLLKGFLDFYRTFSARCRRATRRCCRTCTFRRWSRSGCSSTTISSGRRRWCANAASRMRATPTPSAGSPPSSSSSTATTPASSSSPSARTPSATPSPSCSAWW
ncbi:MAG: hypothetical protein R3E40_03730 [Rhodocyclaceae bacterium]